MSTIKDLNVKSISLYRQASDQIKLFLEQLDLNCGIQTLNKLSAAQAQLDAMEKQATCVKDYRFASHAQLTSLLSDINMNLSRMFHLVNSVMSKHASPHERKRSIQELTEMACEDIVNQPSNKLKKCK